MNVLFSLKKSVLFVLALGFLFLTNISNAERPVKTSNFNLQSKDKDSLILQKAMYFYKKSKALFETKQYDSIQFYFDKSIYLNDNLTVNQEDFTLRLFELANNYFSFTGNSRSSIIYDTKYLKYFENYENWDKVNMTYTYSSIGYNYLMLGEYENSLEKAVIPNEILTKHLITKIKTDTELQDLQVSLLNIYNYELLNNHNLGNIEHSNTIIKKIETLFATIENLSNANKRFIESIFTAIIDISRNSGNFEKAILFIEYYERLYERPSPLVQLRILDQKRKLAFVKKEYSKVIDIHKKAEQIFYTVPNLGYSELNYYRLSLEHYGDVLLRDGFRDYQKAIAINKKCITLLKNQKKTAYTNNSYAYSNLAEIYKGLKQNDSALVYFNKGLEESIAFNTYTQSAILYQKKASFYFNVLNDFSAGEHATEEALKTMGIESLETLETIKDTLVNTRSSMKFLEVVTALAEEHYGVYNRHGRQKSLLLSNSLYLLSSQMLNNIKTENKLNSLEIKMLNAVNNGLLETLNVLQNNKLGHDRIIATIEQLEINQNIELHFRNVLNEITLNTSLIPDEIIKLKAKIESEDLSLKQMLLDAKIEENKTLIFDLRERYQFSQVRLDSIYKVIDKLSPEYALYNQTKFKLEDVQDNLDTNTHIIRYFFSDSTLYAFHISRDQIKFNSIAKKTEIDIIIDDMYSQFSTNEDISAELLNKILGQSFEDIKTDVSVIIVPHQKLNLIPFEILSINNKYLVELANVSYSNSLFFNSKRSKIKNKLRLASFAPNYKVNDEIDALQIQQLVMDGIYELKSAKEEAQTISKLFNGDLYLNSEATKNTFLNKAKDYSILHLAMHTIVDDKSSNNSMLLFTKDSEDSVLKIKDIYSLGINADLTVLSACNTGSGALDPSEGVLSLSRAFQYAGSSSNVMSLWKVPDEQTAKLMTSFYKHLKKGETKNTALKNAKLDYLKNTNDPNLKHPYYWAGFVLTGDTSAIVTPTNYWLYIGFALVGVLLVILLMRQRLKRKS